MAAAVDAAAERKALDAKITEVEKELTGAAGDERVALQQRLAALEQRLATLEQRLATLEQQKLLLMQQQSAAAGGAAAADVEVCAEVVHLSIEGGGAPFSMDCPLYNRKLQVVAIEKSLAAKRLSLLDINGSIPTADEKGYTVKTYEPGSTVNITAEPRADDSFKEGDLQEKRKQRYRTAFQSVLTVLMTAFSTAVVTRLMQRVAV